MPKNSLNYWLEEQQKKQRISAFQSLGRSRTFDQNRELQHISFVVLASSEAEGFDKSSFCFAQSSRPAQTKTCQHMTQPEAILASPNAEGFDQSGHGFARSQQLEKKPSIALSIKVRQKILILDRYWGISTKPTSLRHH